MTKTIMPNDTNPFSEHGPRSESWWVDLQIERAARLRDALRLRQTSTDSDISRIVEENRASLYSDLFD